MFKCWIFVLILTSASYKIAPNPPKWIRQEKRRVSTFMESWRDRILIKDYSTFLRICQHVRWSDKIKDVTSSSKFYQALRAIRNLKQRRQIIKSKEPCYHDPPDLITSEKRSICLFTELIMLLALSKHVFYLITSFNLSHNTMAENINIAKDTDMSGSGNVRKFPDAMKFGIATAAFQIEGGWDAYDKSPSIWDVYCHRPGVVKDGTSGDDACKSFEFYQRDIKMLKFLGVNFYRFSIAWPRILPSGFPNHISKGGSEYYNKLINELIANGIEPVVTMYHWDLPQKLQDMGGWTNPLISDWFQQYAKVLFELYGDRVKIWITINEPKQIGVFGYGMKRFAPGINAHGIAEYLAAKNIVIAHAKAWRLYDKEFRPKQKGTCGITIAVDFREGVTDSPEDVEVGLDAMEFEVGLYSHPIFSEKGGFPDRAVKRVAMKSAEQGFARSRLPEFSEEEIELVKGTSDFFGINHYSTKFYTRRGYQPGMFPVPSYDDDIGAVTTYLDYEKGAVIHCTVIPLGIRKALKWVKDSYNNPPIMITENGFGTFGGLQDLDRISYLRRYLNQVLDAIEIDKCNVTTYTAWSLMDNFEWDSGFSVKFSLFETDYVDIMRKRTAKLSALWYKDMIATRQLKDTLPEFQTISF